MNAETGDAAGQKSGAAGQTWNADEYARHAGFVPVLGAPVLDLLAAKAGERILDLGCGDGVLTAKIAATGASVVGFDASPELIAAARSRGLDARLGNGEALAFDAAFDAVFTNAALHWMRNAEAVVAGVRRALRPGGRFVGEFGGHGNVAAIVTALIAALQVRGIDGAARVPWYFPTPAEYGVLLERHGFRVDAIDLIPRPTPLPTGMAGWLRTFAVSMLHGLDANGKAAVLDEATGLLAPSLRDQAGNWTADYVRLRFVAQL